MLQCASVTVTWISANLLPPPSALVDTLRELGSQGEIYRHVLASSSRTLIGFGVGASLAVLIGTIVGLSNRARVLLDPTFQALRAIPPLYFGGSSDAAGPVAARHTDVYLTWGEPLEPVARKVEWIRGVPHLEEAYWFGEGVLPLLERVGLWAHPLGRRGATSAVDIPFSPAATREPPVAAKSAS